MKDDLCFVDTVCWIALLNQQDHFHESADQHYKKLMKSGTGFVTTSSVLEETANALLRSRVQTISPCFSPQP
jgi:predicted nucleic acid-binding protein